MLPEVLFLEAEIVWHLARQDHLDELVLRVSFLSLIQQFDFETQLVIDQTKLVAHLTTIKVV